MSGDINPDVVLYECPRCHVLMSEAEASLFGMCEECFDYWNDPPELENA